MTAAPPPMKRRLTQCFSATALGLGAGLALGLFAGRTAAAPVKAETLRDGVIRLRIAEVHPGLSGEIKPHLAAPPAGKTAPGLVLDLRFAGGQDCAAALAVVDLFLAGERPLLNLGGRTHKSTAKKDAFTAPVVALVNRETTGAAELLAALLREHRIAVLLGSPTAGRLPAEAADHRLPGGGQLPAGGLAPEISETVSLADERKFMDDPYADVSPAKPAGVASTNRPPGAPRLNEAELVRRQREGPAPDVRLPARPARDTAPVVRDPALARALDLLKGLAVARQARVL